MVIGDFHDFFRFSALCKLFLPTLHFNSINQLFSMKQILFALTLLLSGATFFACGGATQETEDQATTEETVQEADEQTVEEAVQVSETAEEAGPEYTSAYQCPMHCKGSGSDQPGNCPVCGMAYVAKADLENAGNGQLTQPESHEGHDHN
jgi:hypothetical protein